MSTMTTTTISIEELCQCPLCHKTYETDNAKLEAMEGRLPISCTSCCCYTICYECLQQQRMRPEIEQGSISCPHCRKLDAFGGVKDPFVNRILCQILQRMPTPAPSEEQEDNQEKDNTQQSPGSVTTPKKSIVHSRVPVITPRKSMEEELEEEKRSDIDLDRKKVPALASRPPAVTKKRAFSQTDPDSSDSSLDGDTHTSSTPFKKTARSSSKEEQPDAESNNTDHLDLDRKVPAREAPTGSATRTNGTTVAPADNSGLASTEAPPVPPARRSYRATGLHTQQRENLDMWKIAKSNGNPGTGWALLKALYVDYTCSGGPQSISKDELRAKAEQYTEMQMEDQPSITDGESYNGGWYSISTLERKYKRGPFLEPLVERTNKGKNSHFFKLTKTGINFCKELFHDDTNDAPPGAGKKKQSCMHRFFSEKKPGP